MRDELKTIAALWVVRDPRGCLLNLCEGIFAGSSFSSPAILHNFSLFYVLIRKRAPILANLTHVHGVFEYFWELLFRWFNLHQTTKYDTLLVWKKKRLQIFLDFYLFIYLLFFKKYFCIKYFKFLIYIIHTWISLSVLEYRLSSSNVHMYQLSS